MGAYTWACMRCGLVMPSGAIHFGDACDRHRLKVSEGKVTGLQAEIAELQRELAEWRSGERKREPETRFEEYETGVAKMNQELAEWRAGKRRVWWRTRWADGGCADDVYKKRAAGWAKSCWGKYTLYRVTVGPAKKKEAG